MAGSLNGVRIAVALAILLFTAAFARAEPPSCTDAAIVEDVTFIFDSLQEFDTKSGRRLVALQDARETGFESHAPIQGDLTLSRYCAWRGKLDNNETIAVHARVIGRKGDPGNDYRLPLCFSKYGDASVAVCPDDLRKIGRR